MGIENLVGSAYDDVLIGFHGSVNGGTGDDVLAGADVLDGGEGAIRRRPMPGSRCRGQRSISRPAARSRPTRALRYFRRSSTSRMSSAPGGATSSKETAEPTCSPAATAVIPSWGAQATTSSMAVPG